MIHDLPMIKKVRIYVAIKHKLQYRFSSKTICQTLLGKVFQITIANRIFSQTVHIHYTYAYK